MKQTNFKTLLIGLILIILSLLFIIYLYNKPSIDVENSNAKLAVSVQELPNDYPEDENKAK